jgi:hypothetical protein
LNVEHLYSPSWSGWSGYSITIFVLGLIGFRFNRFCF